MVWHKVIATGAAYLAPYIENYVRKKIAKEIIYGRIDDFVDEEGFVKNDIMGIKELNRGEKSIDSYASDYILSKDVSEWNENDYQFLRMTKDYDRNWQKRQKVLEYLNYKKRQKKTR